MSYAKESSESKASGDDKSYGSYFGDGNDGSNDNPMPVIVLDAMKRRQIEQKLGIASREPSQDVVEALREHFLSSNADYSHGGFIDCMEAIGAVPHSQDPLVYDPSYNIDENCLGNSIGEEEHEARVRLFRYKEFIDFQSSKGIKPGADWAMSNEYTADYEGSDTSNTSSGNHDLTDAQFHALAQSFSMNFYFYVNNDNIMAKNVKGGTYALPEKLIQLEISEGAIIDQCHELKSRYRELGCPLAPKSVLLNPVSVPPTKSKKGKGKKGRNRRCKSNNGTARKGSGWGLHSDEITSRLTVLLDTFGKQFSPSTGLAEILASVASMLVSATCNDPDIAKAFVNDEKSNCGTMAIELRARSLEQAKRTKNRHWWAAYSLLTDVLGYSVDSQLGDRGGSAIPAELDSHEGTPASAFFFEALVPELVRSIESIFPEERSAALHNLDRASTYAPHNRVLRLVGSKKTWGIIEHACRNALNECKLNSEEARVSSWQKYTKHIELGEAALLLYGLCSRALTSEEKGNLTSIVPTALAAKMVKRGVVPLLVDIAKAGLGYPSAKAMDGLAAISRVKDCRTIIYQDSGGIELLEASLASKDGSLVSPTLLLITHLLWDKEWWELLSSCELQIEATAVRWGLFAMDSIIKRAAEARKTGKDMLDELQALTIEAFHLGDGEEKDEKMQAVEEVRKKLAHHSNESWLNLETEQNQDSLDFLLGRCLLVLSVSCGKLTNGPHRMMHAGGLSLSSLCLDSPIVDIQSASAICLHNTIARLGVENVTPGCFLDPVHTVRSIVTVLHRLWIIGDRSQRFEVFVLLVRSLKQCPKWGPYFEKLSLFDQQTANAIGHIRIETSYEEQEDSGNVNEKCSNHTGKLRSCDSCGKMESKKGNFMQCSRCRQATYCSKECQVNHWRQLHKAQCKHLSKASSGS